ncbi:hypothetical protein BRARA_C00194 [Brassica rapa]|uniref:Coatomer subunit delta n=2 Tax=Brassica campestris TaxID=3711 RepID=A0A397ZU99_BRACM|nr:hypothetical protein BRARA_C00194 [Brassica rapa]
MVVTNASIVTKSGKVLVSRQYVDMSRIVIEGLLAAFPKLVGLEKQHTYFETENVRYVYQPIEALFLLLVTTKQSNILQDLDTLRLLSKLVPEYCMSLDEEGIGRANFDLIHAFDEVISLGHKEDVTVAQVKQYCEMESHEEKPDQPFPTGQGGGGVGLLRWRMQRADESMVPLTINCWPSVSGNETYVSIEYEASSMFDLTNVIISVPLPALRDAPIVKQCDGDWRYDSRNSVLEWSMLLIDNSNRSGSMEFVVPPVDSSVFFPISVQFAATSTYSGLKVTGMIPLRGGSGGATPKFVQRTQLIAQDYQVV